MRFVYELIVIVLLIMLLVSYGIQAYINEKDNSKYGH